MNTLNEALKLFAEKLLNELNIAICLTALAVASIICYLMIPNWQPLFLALAIFCFTLASFIGIRYLFRYLKQPGLILLPSEVPITTFRLPELPDILWEVSKKKETPLRDKFGYYGSHPPSMDDYINIHYLSNCICITCKDPYIIRNKKRRITLLCPKCGKLFKLKNPHHIQERVWKFMKDRLREEYIGNVYPNISNEIS